MSFFLFLLLALFVVYVLMPLVRVYLRVRRQQQAFNDLFGGRARQRQPRGGGERPGGWSTRPASTPRKKKKIDSSVGEYVDYEEIVETTSTTDTAGNAHTDFKRESQITDVEWEDVK